MPMHKGKTAMVAAIVSAIGTMAVAAVSYEAEIPAFRRDVDSWRVQYGASGEWTDGMFAVTVPGRRNFIMNYSRYPGMKPFAGPEGVVIETESDGLGKATAELVLFEFPGGERKHFYAPLEHEIRFKTQLDPAKQYQLGIIGIHRTQKDGKRWKIGFKSLRGVFKTGKAAALHVDATTGNPLHIVREGKDEHPVLCIRNLAQERIAAQGVLKVKGFSGEVVDMPVDIVLEGGKIAEIPISGTTKKGVWKIGGEIKADDGSVAKVDTRFAVMDCHDKTPMQSKGTFRLGVLWHLQRFTPEDRRLTAEAMVACGAKLTRADMANMASIQEKGPDCWDFARTDELMETLETNGIAIDAIIFRNPRWAAAHRCRTNDNWRVWTFGPPLEGTFGKFCEQLSERYGTRIDYYEIGNEWDMCFYGSAGDAVAVLREAYAGLKRGCRDVCVLPCGWTLPETYIAKEGRTRGIHEYVLRNGKEYFDVHPIHCHGAFARYAHAIRNEFFPLRNRTGVEGKPWFSNETALTSVWSERTAALTVWKKILWAWANGSVDYIWYNLKATGWNPKDPEQGYGIVTADFKPRDAYVAFAALATLVGGAEFKQTMLDEGGRYVYAFAKNGSVVLAAWDESDSGQGISVKTDASCAWRVDLMGNRQCLPLSGGKAVLKLGVEPYALVLENATFSELCGVDGKVSLKDNREAIVIPPDIPGRKPDFIFDKPEQVHDFFEANPAEVKRLWNGPKDNSGKVWLSKEARGLRIRVEVEDDVHCQTWRGEEQYMGDDVQVALAAPGQGGQWEFGFAHHDDGRAAVHCWISPSGFSKEDAAAWIELETGREGTITRYDAFIPYAEERGYTEKTLEDGIRFNLMVNDNDGDGRDATIEILPNTFHSKDISLAPVIRFPKRNETRNQ